MSKHRLPWIVCAALIAAGVPALASGEERAPAAADATMTIHDNSFQDAATTGADDHAVSITTGGKVTFLYNADGSSAAPHNVAFTGTQPTLCKQTAGSDIDPDSDSPLPDIPQGVGWAGYCTFDAPGSYPFVCQVHGGMEGTVEVTGAGTPTPTPSDTSTPTATPTATATTQPAASPAPAVVPAPTPAATPAAKPAPKIAAATFKRSKRTVKIAGTTTATGKVTVKLAYKVGKKARTKTLRITITRGKFSGTLKLSATDAKKASKLSVTVSAAGTGSAKKAVSVRR